jgi:hypothetical protein
LTSDSDQFDDRHLGPIAATRAELRDPCVAARPIRIPRANLIEQLRDDVIVTDLRKHKPASVEIAATSLRDDLLGVRPNLTSLGVSGRHPLVNNELGRHIRKNLALVLGAAAEAGPSLRLWH